MNIDQIGFDILPPMVIDERHPGHMSVRFRHPSGEVAFRGFRFVLSDLPDDCESAESIRRFLLRHCVPGYVMDDIAFAKFYDLFRRSVMSGVFAIRDLTVMQSLYSSDVTQVRWYSFNPDDFPNCHNCVTWAVDTINRATRSAVLPRPRHGRVSEMLRLLKNLRSPGTSETTP